MKVSIIIPNRNTKQLTLDCLQSIADTAPPLEYEIILVDNASTDGTLDAVRVMFPQVNVIENQRNLGFGKACNAGAKASTGEVLLFLNSDTIIHSDAAQLVLSIFKSRPEIGMASPQLMNSDGSMQNTAAYVITARTEISGKCRKQARAELAQSIESGTDIPASCYLSGAALWVRKSAFEQIGGFDESLFLYFEDMDLCRCIASKGWKMTLVPEARVVHLGGASSKPISIGVSIEMMRTRCQYIRKHDGLLPAFMVGTAYFLNRLRRTLFAGIGALFTLGLSSALRAKVLANAAFCLWFLLGMPRRQRWIYRKLFCDWDR